LTLSGIVLYLSIYQANTLELTYEEKQEMTRKDYVLIANLLKNANEDNYDNALTPLIKWFADDLEKDNPRFDRARFLTACGVK
jgi:hypothetical protein